MHFPKNHDMIFSTSAMGKCLITNRVIWDTNGTDTGSAKDDLNGGHNESGRADEDGQMDGTVETRRYDRALAASLSQLILNRIGE